MTSSRQTTDAALTELRKDFVRRGWHKRASGRIVVELLSHVALVAGGIFLFITGQHLALRAFGLILATYGGMGVGTNTHNSTHYATSARRWVNEALSYFGFPLFLGVSATFWWHKHVVVHHPSPNVMGVDADADLLPWFALTTEEIAASRGLRRFFYERVQFWVFPLALAGTCFNMQAAGLAYLVRGLFRSARRLPGEDFEADRPRHARRAAYWMDCAAIVLHFVIWIGLPLLWWPLSSVIGFYFLRVALLGYAMYIVLGPGHLPADAQRTSPEAGAGMTAFEIQTAGSLNFRTGFLGRLVCSGLEYQVEHHMFPNVSYVYYPKLSHVLEAFCVEHGLPYRALPWSEAVWKSWQVLRQPQPVIAKPALGRGFATSGD